MSKGHDRERQLGDFLEARNWVVVRAAGSLGGIDLVAMKIPRLAVLIEVKANLDGGPYENFRPAEREKLLGAAAKGDVRCVLAWWPPDRKGIRWIGPRRWPGAPFGPGPLVDGYDAEAFMPRA